MNYRVSSDVTDAALSSTGSATLSLAYGYSINEEGNDPLIDVIDHITAMFGEAQIPGRFLVDTLPFLQYLPRWVPGIRDFKCFIDEARLYSERKVNLPMKFVREEMVCRSVNVVSDHVAQRFPSPVVVVQHAMYPTCCRIGWMKTR